MNSPLSQKDAFLRGEANNYVIRNEESLKNYEKRIELDYLLKLILDLPIKNDKSFSVLEIGCGDGLRLLQLKDKKNWELYGIDPSSIQVKKAVDSGLNVSIGSADKLDFPSSKFDLVIFGFCLCWCDPIDLFKISSEAHRVLKPKSWLALHDFWSKDFKSVPYKHLDGLNTYKYDLIKMFDWHPSYVVYEHKIQHYLNGKYTYNKNDWTNTTILSRSDDWYRINNS